MVTITGSVSETVHGTSTSEELSERVVESVAEAKGVDPLELGPLYDSIDPDALNSLFRGSPDGEGAPAELRFTMAGCEVLVREGGEVVVTPEPGAGERPDRNGSRE